MAIGLVAFVFDTAWVCLTLPSPFHTALALQGNAYIKPLQILLL
jgi:hypothetical protein